MATPPPRYGRLSLAEISTPGGDLTLDGGDDLWSVAERLVDALERDCSVRDEEGVGGEAQGEAESLSSISHLTRSTPGEARGGSGRGDGSVLENTFSQLRARAEEAGDASMSRLVEGSWKVVALSGQQHRLASSARAVRCSNNFSQLRQSLGKLEQRKERNEGPRGSEAGEARDLRARLGESEAARRKLQGEVEKVATAVSSAYEASAWGSPSRPTAALSSLARAGGGAEGVLSSVQELIGHYSRLEEAGARATLEGTSSEAGLRSQVRLHTSIN